MAISFVAVSSNAGATGTEPTGTAVGDVIIAGFLSTSASIAAPAGWRLVAPLQTRNGYTAGFWWIVRDVSAPSYAWTNTVGANAGYTIATFRGAVGAVIDQVGSDPSNLSPALNANMASEWLICGYHDADSAITITAPSGMTLAGNLGFVTSIAYLGPTGLVSLGVKTWPTTSLPVGAWSMTLLAEFPVVTGAPFTALPDYGNALGSPTQIAFVDPFRQLSDQVMLPGVDASGVGIGDGVVDGFVSTSGAVTGAATGAGTVSGVVGTVGQTIGTVTGSAVTAGLLGTAGVVAGTETGSGTVTGAVGTLKAVTGTATGVGTVSGVVGAVGQVNGVATGSGVVAGGAFSGTVTGTATGVGTVSGVVGKVGTVTGLGTAVSSPAGAVGIFGTVTGTATGAGTVAGAVGLFKQVTGTATGAGTVTGAVGILGAVTGTATGAGTVTGGVGDFIGTVTGAASGTGTVAGSVGKVGSITALVTGSATLSGSVGKISGIIGIGTGSGLVTGVRISGVVASAWITALKPEVPTVTEKLANGPFITSKESMPTVIGTD